MAASDYMTSNIFILVMVILFIVYLSYYIYSSIGSMNKKKLEDAKIQYKQNVCPDYWESVHVKQDENGNSIHTCRNNHAIGKCSIQPNQNEFTFSDDIFLNSGTRDIAKCNYAKDCGISWSGYDHLC